MRIIEMENDNGDPIIEIENLKRYVRSNFLSSAIIGFALAFMFAIVLFR